ncbi:MAG: hypothetical protein M1819_003118 [Sarea resinae]|nr:MAG: hypothetical protein M1819_003118 [Sarea resinae]
MAVDNPSLRAQAEAVKQALSTNSACSLATVSVLDQLLNAKIEAIAHAQVVASGRKSKLSSTTKGRARAGTSIKAGARSKVGAIAIHEERQCQLNSRDKTVLATEVINNSLKTLTAAVKVPPPENQRQVSPKIIQLDEDGTTSKKLPPRSTTIPRDTLGTRSPNRLSSSPAKPSARSRTSSSGSSLVAVAECARLGFAYLRSLESDNTKVSSMPVLQLENGMLALITKLHTLGLDELATKELRILRTRIDTLLETSCCEPTETKKDRSVLRKGMVNKKETLSDLIQFRQVEGSAGVIGLVVGMQTQTLKIISSTRRPALVSAVFETIQISNPSSPANLILRYATDSSKTKASHQLELLAQVVLSLCPNISSSDDVSAMNPKQAVSPETTFRLQSLAFELRLLWWTLSGHQGDAVKDILDPFARCLNAFTRRFEGKASRKYELAEKELVKLLERLQKCSSITQLNKDTKGFATLYGIYKFLGSIGQEASYIDKALRWTTAIADLLNFWPTQHAKLCFCSVRLATLELREIGLGITNQNTKEILAKALESLEGPLKGDSKDIDDLVVEVTSLRKSAALLLSSLSSSSTNFGANAIDIREICESIIYTNVRFLLRYLGNGPVPEAGTKARSRYDQRKRIVGRTSAASIDSLCALLKYNVSNDRLSWETLDGSLQECCTLQTVATNLDESERTPPQSGLERQLPFVKVSNLYWTYYLERKKRSQPGLDSQLLRCLRRSVDAIRDRPQIEKTAGFLAVKHERLGNLYQHAGRLQEARESYTEAINAHINTGVLRSATIQAATKSLSGVWSTEGETGILGRVVAALVKTTLKEETGRSIVSPPFDDEKLESDQRGLLLEAQFNVVIAVLQTSAQSSRVQAALMPLSAKLLDVYDRACHPVRRLRVVIAIFNLNTSYPKLFGPSFIEGLFSEAARPLAAVSGDDTGLMRFLPHLRAMSIVTSTLGDGCPSIRELKEALEIWSSLLKACENWSSIIERIDDTKLWLLQLRTIADYFEVQGLEELKAPTLTMIIEAMELQEPADYTALVADLSELGLNLLRLGYSGKAGLMLAKARKYAEKEVTGVYSLLRWHLAYAEYFIELGNMEKSHEHLDIATALSNKAEVLKDAGPSATIGGRVRLNRLIADANYVYSLLALEEGKQHQAICYAKKSVKLNYRAWAGLESKATRNGKRETSSSSDSEVEAVATGLSSLTVIHDVSCPVISTTHESRNGPQFWSLVPSLYRTIYHLSYLFSIQGMLQESVCYAEQALKVAEAVHALPLIAHNLALLGDYWNRGGKIEKGREMLKQSELMTEGLSINKRAISLHCWLGRMHQLNKDWNAENKAYSDAEAVLDGLTAPAFLSGVAGSSSGNGGIEEQMAKLSFGDSSTSRKPRPLGRPKPSTIPTKRKPSAKSLKPSNDAPRSVSGEYAQLLRIRGDLLRRKAFTMLSQQDIESATSLLAEAQDLPCGLEDVVQQRLCNARQLLQQALEDLVSDPVFCFLPESTISFPSVALSRKDDSEGTDSATGRAGRRSPSRNRATKPTAVKRNVSRAPKNESFADLLCQAHENVCEGLAAAVRVCSTSTIHKISMALSSIVMFISAAALDRSKMNIHPALAAYSMEIARTISVEREKMAIQLDADPTSHADLLKWPVSLDGIDDQRKEMASSWECAGFQNDFIDIIPEGWTAVSISLSEAHDELNISRLRAGQSPFLLRLPLGRQKSRDFDEEGFDFNEGKEELRQIIDLANSSTHDARDMTQSGAKSEWWAEREALDARLKDLLMNMEHIWLGGFRGIFSQQKRQPELLSRFQLSFHNILDKYLPSRQKTNKRHKIGNIVLDPRILELFVGLGNATAEDVDLDEELTDLLYFVVDILQYHGERNAYDEIDFDSVRVLHTDRGHLLISSQIVVETQDALRCYHEAAKAQAEDSTKQHIILILDKRLHVFPWESMPCLEGVSVSRMPSLGCLRDRIFAQRAKAGLDKPERFYVDRNDGTYILNPSGDLKSTQNTFQEPLSKLTTWTSITNRSPTESELETALSTRSLYLYFGHGSGAQFIRSRTIKKLPHCAVAFLMGCSSGSLTEAGEFEPYGTPMSYAHAGCPALVATLWDVTDKDIDRFAVGALERWGLFNGVAEVPDGVKGKANGNGKGKGKERARSRGRGQATKLHGSRPGGRIDSSHEPECSSLVQAVAKARDECVLRYLNGAAPVVYGIPVYLS